MAAWMLYGANGYTGQLIAAEAARRGLKPILAGRNEPAVRSVADRHGLEARVFALDDSAAIARELEGVATVLLAAGPFGTTSGPMVEACMVAGANYLDVAGELGVAEVCLARDAEARARGCVVMSAAGFITAAADCLAAALNDALPDATRLDLAYGGNPTVSRGTVRTLLVEMPKGGAIRERGEIRPIPLASRTIEARFRHGTRTAVAVPWADLATAYRTTGIPNVGVYVALPAAQIATLRAVRFLAPLLRTEPVQYALGRGVDLIVGGPSEQMLRTARMQLWGQATNAAGRSVEAFAETPQSYAFTARATVEIVERLSAGGVRPGATTVGAAFGARFLTELPGCELRVRAPSAR